MKHSKEESLNELIPIYDEICDYLKEKHNYEIQPSCNVDITKYCIPAGAQSENTYYGKPENSLRFSDHWSWYSNIKKCHITDYIQCYNIDIPEPYERQDPNKATKPINAVAIAIFHDGEYHTLTGLMYNRATQKWHWEKPCLNKIIEKIEFYLKESQ